MARKASRKGPSRNQQKKKFRPQDPFYRGKPLVESDKKNRGPKGDKDASDIPPIFGGGGMFGGGGGKNMFGKPSPAVAEDVADKKGNRKKGRKRGRTDEDDAESGPSSKSGAARRRRAQENAEKRAASTVAATATPAPAAAKPALPKQRPGESTAEYGRRVDAAARAQMQSVRKKMTTDNQRQKRKDREKAIKEKKKPNASAGGDVAGDNVAGMLSKVDRPSFGEVVERPPILGDASMKSRTKLKSGLKTPSTGHGISAAADLSDYASKVQGAYEAMKQARREAAASKKI